MKRPHNTAIYKAVVNGAARAAFVQAWASYIEEHHPEKTRGWGGLDLMDLAPKTPAKARTWAKELVKVFETMNDRTIERVVNAVHSSDDVEKIAEDFGYYLAMESMGHGVSWSDSHDAHGFLVPMSEFNMHSAKDCGGYVSENVGLAHRG